MSVSRPDVVVVGAGVMGAATARELARAGRDVVVIERHAIEHTEGSSHGDARIWRMLYRDPRYIRMMVEALPLWRELEDEVGEQLLSVTGAFGVGPGVGDVAAAMGEAGVASEWWTPEQVRERFPQVALEGDVLFDPMAGVVRADLTWRASIDSAVRHGARLLEGVEASLRRDGTATVVLAGDEELRPRVVVVTAGAWVQTVMAPLGIEVPVRPSRETVSFWSGAGEMPVLIDWSEPLLYSLPTPSGTFKIGEHIAGPTIEPGTFGDPDEGSIAKAETWLRHRLPGVDLQLAHAETCLYTNTEDERFILERHGDVVIGSPCSGHGFKFAPLIGRRLAAIVAEA